MKVMKNFFTTCAFLTLTALPAIAAGSLQNSVGQPVMDLQHNQVGTIKSFATVNGQQSAVVATSSSFGHHDILLATSDLQSDSSGNGVLVALTDSSIAQLPPYIPAGLMPAIDTPSRSNGTFNPVSCPAWAGRFRRNNFLQSRKGRGTDRQVRLFQIAPGGRRNSIV